MRITLNYKYTLYIGVAHTSCLAGSLNTFVSIIPVPSSGVPFAHPFIDRKLYYNSSLSLNKSIDLASTSL